MEIKIKFLPLQPLLEREQIEKENLTIFGIINKDIRSGVVGFLLGLKVERYKEIVH